MNIFITGGTRGIGLALAEHYLSIGAKVAVTSTKSPSEIGKLPSGCVYYQADVAEEKSVVDVVARFVNDHGSLDMIIANAGVSISKKVIPDPEQGKRVIQVNVLGVIHTFNTAIPYFLKQKKGHFVVIGSLASFNGLPGSSYYSASKAFVGTFCESLAIDLKDLGIDVTCINPGFIDTELVKKNKHPMPFLMSAEKAARLIARAIEKKKEVFSFPFAPALFVKILRLLPKAFFYWMMRKDILNFKKGSTPPSAN